MSSRFQRLEKAFLLAVDLGARDLFMVSDTLRHHALVVTPLTLPGDQITGTLHYNDTTFTLGLLVACGSENK